MDEGIWVFTCIIKWLGALKFNAWEKGSIFSIN